MVILVGVVVIDELYMLCVVNVGCGVVFDVVFIVWVLVLFEIVLSDFVGVVSGDEIVWEFGLV